MKCIVCNQEGSYHKDIRANAAYCREHHKYIKEAEEKNDKYLASRKYSKNR